MQNLFEPPPVRHFRSWLRVLALATGLSCTLTAHAGTLDDANQQFKAGQHAKALELVDKHLAAQPKDPQGRFLKGLILTALNRQNEAIVIFTKLTEDQPDWPQPYNNLAVLYAQQKQYEKAKEALEQAIRTDKNYATAHENLSYIYSRLASQAYEKALQINSSDSAVQPRLTMINDLSVSKAAPASSTAPTSEKATPPTTPTIVPPAPAPAAPSPVKVAESAPATAAAPAPAAAKPASIEGEITAAIDSWLAAWSRKDVKAYLAHYAQDFQPPRNLTRKEWEAERIQRVGKPGQIEVSRDKLSIKAEGADKASVHFRQHYRSASFKSSSAKTLLLVKREGKWLILREQAG